MRNDSVLYRVMHVAHDAKCFSPSVYSHLHRQLSDNFIPSQKCQLKGRMSIKERGRTPGLIENKASLRLIRKSSYILTCFDRVQSLHLEISVVLIFCTRVTRVFDKILCITPVIKCPV